MRCFVAAFVEADSARGLQQVYRAGCGTEDVAAGLRHVPPASYHVTLKFLGDVGPGAVPDVLDAVAELRGTATRGMVLGFVGFPRPAATRVVVAELAAHEQLTAWWLELERTLGAGDRSFRPHVTIARSARPRRFEPVELPEPVPLALTAPCLYRSDPTARGSRYRPVSVADLNGS